MGFLPTLNLSKASMVLAYLPRPGDMLIYVLFGIVNVGEARRDDKQPSFSSVVIPITRSSQLIQKMVKYPLVILA